MTRSKYIYVLAIIILALAGYFYFSRTDSKEVVEEQKADASIPVSPEELAELQKDQTAPEWLRDAKSCVWVGEKIFCKLQGE